MNDQKQQKPLCPFKRIVEREYSSTRGMTSLRERFDVCAGERCMAYRVPDYGLGESGGPTCKRLEMGSK